MSIKNLTLLYGGAMEDEKIKCNNTARLDLSKVILKLRKGLVVKQIDDIIDFFDIFIKKQSTSLTQENLSKIKEEYFVKLTKEEYIIKILEQINQLLINSFNITNSNDIIIRFVNCLADFVYNIKPFIVNILNKCECHFNNGTTIVLDKSELDYVKDLSVINSVSSSDFFTSINSAEQLIKQIKMSHRNCPLCPFNNSGDNTNKNKCQEFDTSVSYCFGPDRLNEELYLRGVSNFVLENNIITTEPDGEVCFGNTITSCVTFCLIFQNNKKLAVHVNPLTNFSVYSLLEDSAKEIKESEDVSIYNVFDKFLEKIALNNLSENLTNKIRKIIILAENKVGLYSNIPDNYLKTISNSDIVHKPAMNSYYTNKYKLDTEDINSMKLFIKRKLHPYVMDDPNDPNNVIIFIQKQISGGSVYFVNSVGTGIYVNKSVREEF